MSIADIEANSSRDIGKNELIQQKITSAKDYQLNSRSETIEELMTQ